MKKQPCPFCRENIISFKPNYDIIELLDSESASSVQSAPYVTSESSASLVAPLESSKPIIFQPLPFPVSVNQDLIKAGNKRIHIKKDKEKTVH